jgi:predicted acylesterase/phospholipase RssA
VRFVFPPVRRTPYQGMLPRRIYLCGGGVNAIAHIGVLEELHKEEYLKLVEEWIGISAGSLLAMCLVAGYTMQEAREFLTGFDFNELSDPDSAPGWVVNAGFDTGNRLQRLVCALLNEKGYGPETTFAELYERSGMKLRVYATDLNSATLVEYSPASTPTYPLAYAVRASMSIPYYFQPVTCPQTGHMLVDGGVITNYPLAWMSEADRADTLAICFWNKVKAKETLELMDMVMQPISIMSAAHQPIDCAPYMHQTVVVHVGGRSPVHFGIGQEDKEALLELGRKGVREYFARMRPVRRYSVS